MIKRKGFVWFIDGSLFHSKKKKNSARFFVHVYKQILFEIDVYT